MKKLTRYPVSVLCLLLFILVGCDSDNDGNEGSNTFEMADSPIPPLNVRVVFTDCRTFNISEEHNVECGFLHTLENRTRDNSPQIQLAFAIIKSEAEHPIEEPIVYLDGGPGASPIDRINNWIYRSIPYRINRDFILLDQRGTGFSKPSLDCSFNEDLELLTKKHLTRTEIMRPCWEMLIDQGVDLTAYNNEQNAEDVDDLRRALGYKKLNLYGISYGTRLALTIMRNHPEGVRSVILDSVVAPQKKRYEEAAMWANQTFNLLFQECERDLECNQAFPDLKSRFFNLVDQLNSAPESLEIVTGQRKILPLIINGDDIVTGLFGALYEERLIRLLPLLIYGASEDLESVKPLFQLIATEVLRDYISEGMNYSTICHNEIPFHDFEKTTAEISKYPRFEKLFDFPGLVRLCDLWQAGVASVETNEPLESAIPTLIITGEYDPITPPELGETVAETLSGSFFYEFRGGTHGASLDFPCAKQLIRDFLENPSISPNDQCVEKLPPLKFVSDQDSSFLSSSMALAGAGAANGDNILH